MLSITGAFGVMVLEKHDRMVTAHSVRVFRCASIDLG